MIKTLLTAAWVMPMSGPVVRDGGVVFEGDLILAIDNAQVLKDRHLDVARLVDLGAAIILPGLINAHTHLELSSCACGDPPTSPASFVDWILSMPRRIGREVNQRADELFAASTKLGIEQCLRFGVTCVGDISQQMHVTRPILRDSPLRAVSFGEVLGLGKRRARFEELLPMAIDERDASERLRIGLSPHSPYTLEPDAIRRCVKIADERRLPLAIHLAETSFEREFLKDHAGPLQEMWERLGSWEDFLETYGGSPVGFAQSLGLLDRPTVLAHVNYCDERDIALLALGRASVVYCPRTHRYFGHPRHKWQDMIGAGINVAIGTDSCASSPDLNLVDELRLLHEIEPYVPAKMLWQMATRNAARALGWEKELETAADFVVFDVSTDQPLAEILETDRLPREVWIAGQKITRTPRPASPC